MLVFHSNNSDSHFTWNDERLEELHHPYKYDAHVEWPNGESDIVELIIITRYEGYNDDRVQEAFFVIDHKGYSSYLELQHENYFSMIKNLVKVKYA